MLTTFVAIGAYATNPSVSVSNIKITGQLTSETIVAQKTDNQNNAATRHHVSSRSVIVPNSIEELCSMHWEASYTGTISSNQGEHTGEAVFQQLDGRLYLTLPGYEEQPLLVNAQINEDECYLLIYGTVFFDHPNYDVRLQPWDWSTKTATAEYGLKISFNLGTGGFSFPENVGWAMAGYDKETEELLGYFWGGNNISIVTTDREDPLNPEEFTYKYKGNTLIYSIIDEATKTCKVGKNEDISGDVYIPEVANGYTVISIGDEAFSGCVNMTSIEIPNSVKTIDDRAFNQCFSLSSIEIPNSVTSIGVRAFCSCRSLTSIVIPESVSTIGEYAFFLCYGLETVELPNSLETIAPHAFNFCKSLNSIVIPNSVTNVGTGAFSNCTSLTSAVVSNSMSTIENGCFSHCSSLTSVIIPESITMIGSNAFDGCTSLASVTIPNSVFSIGGQAFQNCSAITEIELSTSVTYIGYLAFDGCTSLKTIISYAVTPPYCHDDICSQETYDTAILYVPGKSIDNYKSVVEWSKFVNIIGMVDTFNVTVNGVNYTLNQIDKTATVTYTEQNSLSNYEGALSIVVPETVEYEGAYYTVTNIGDEAFNNCWGLKSVSLPSTLQSIGKLAFGYCTSLRSVEIPDAVTIINNEAFTGCSALASVQIGNSVETIGDYAFFGCTGLSSLHVPESVKTIGENAFMGIHWINEVQAKSATPAEAPISAFSQNAYKSATLTVPNGSLAAYQAHPTWSNFQTIREVGDISGIIEVVEDGVVVKGTETVIIYNISGSKVYSGAADRIKLPSGIYLVVTESLKKTIKL